MNVYYYPEDKIRMLFSEQGDFFIDEETLSLNLKVPSGWWKTNLTIINYLYFDPNFKEWFEKLKTEQPEKEKIKLLHENFDVKAFIRKENKKGTLYKDLRSLMLL